MYKINDIVLYGSEGVCEVSEIMTRSFADKKVNYYVLKPIYAKQSTIYVPVDSEELTEKMKTILSSDEIIDLIHRIPGSESIWIANENQRKERYKDILKSGNRQELMQLIRTLYLHQQDLKEQGKKFHASDDKFFKEAEKILYEEFAYVLNIQRDEVIPFICKLIDVKEKQEAS